jgi:hypothetical protein
LERFEDGRMKHPMEIGHEEKVYKPVDNHSKTTSAVMGGLDK